MKMLNVFLVLIAVLVSTGFAHATLAVTNATIAHGKLTVTGTTNQANQTVTLDGQFTVNSDAQKNFVFSLTNYHPSDCVVTVVVGAKHANGVVGNCGDAGTGANITGTIHGAAGAIPAHSCVTTAITVGGATVGDAGMISFTGDVPVPAGLVFSFIKVTSADNATLRICNPTNSPSAAFTDVGVRVVTFK
jgi:hypothetical protein